MHKIQSMAVIAALLWSMLTIAGCGGGGSSSGYSYDNGGGSSTTITAPSVTSVNNLNQPGQPLRVGDWAEINGSGFGSSQQGNYSNGYVAFASTSATVKATSYSTWTDTQVVCQVPLGAPIKVPQARETMNIIVVHPDSEAGSSPLQINADPNPNPTPQPTPPSPSPSPSATATPSPTTTTSPTPTPTPTPSPSPTSGGGGGGGGTAPPHITEITPSKDEINTSSPVNFIIKGSGFGASQASVNGMVSFFSNNLIPLGTAGFSAGHAACTSLAFNNGIPYVAYRDGGNGSKATVMKYTGNGATGWEAVGTAGFSAGGAYYTSLAFNNGIPYVAYMDNANSNKATVMKYTGNGATGWEAVGTAGFSAGTAEYTSLAFDNGIPYVAYRDGGNSDKATLMKYTGNGATGWEAVGTSGFSTGGAGRTSLAFNNGIPYVAYLDWGNGNKATVMKYTGNGATGWEAVGTAGFSAGGTDYTSLAFDNGTPYVAYMDGSNSDKATVMKYTGNGATGWEAVGTAEFSTGGAAWTSLAFDNGIPYVAYMDGGKGWKATVMKYTGNGGTGWEEVGTAGFSAGTADYTSLAFNNGIPYVAYMDGGNGGKATVSSIYRKYATVTDWSDGEIKGTVSLSGEKYLVEVTVSGVTTTEQIYFYKGLFWNALGTAGFSAGTAEYTSLAFDNGIPYVAYRDGGNSNKATVMKYTGNGATGWEAVGTAGFSAGTAEYTSLAFNNGIPYVAYSDDANGSKATVMKYTGNGTTGWEAVGTAGFSAGTADCTSLAFDNGIPYVAYRDGANINKATVMKYTGNGATGWEAVGTAGFSAGQTYYTSLVFDNGIPYVAYRDGANGGKATVMKYTGNGATGWEAVGTAGFSAGTADCTSLAFNNGIPYVAYRDGVNGWKATVMKYTGNGATGWEAVGTAGFSASDANSTSLAFDNGIPYVVYTDGGSRTATVMKYTGNGATGWETVGTAGFSAGSADYTSLAFNNGIPYVAYSDGGNGWKATVMTPSYKQ